MRVRIYRRNALIISAFATTLLTATSFLASLNSPAIAAQTIPYTINFQGRLTDNNGNILPDGSYNIKFRIFNASSAGTNMWEGDRVYSASDRRVAISNGLFNIQFGDTSQGDPALSPTLFSGTYPLYLEVELPTPATATCNTNGCASFTEGAMTPRQALASAPYAFNSDTLDGLDSTGFIKNQTGQQTSASFNIDGSGTAGTSFLTPLLSTVSGDINIDPAGNTVIKGSTSNNTAAALNVVDSGGSNSLLYVRNDGNVGIGTTSPGAKLHVLGASNLQAGSAGASQVNLLSSTGTNLAQIRATTGSNIGIGNNVFNALTTGTYNTAMGEAALQSNTSGFFNTAFGLNALKTMTEGFQNTAVGSNALEHADGIPGALPGLDGTNNTAVGANAGQQITTGHRNVAVGVDALFLETTGTHNVAIGVHALNSQVGVDGSTGIGYSALISNVSGINNTAVGNQALGAVTSDNNTALGGLVATAITSGSNNTAIGTYALSLPNANFSNATTTGGYQTAVGALTGQSSATQANYTVALGYNALFGADGATALGSYTQANYVHSTALGFGAITTANYQLVVGGAGGGITDAYFGNGVTNATPNNIALNATGGNGTNVIGGNLTVAGGKATGNAVGGSILFQTSDAGSSGTTPQALTTKMTILGNGNVGIGATNPGAKLDVSGGNINIDATSSTTGQITQAGSRIIHTFGSNNFFAGTSAGNFTTSGTGFNVGIGPVALGAVTSGSVNVGVGGLVLQNTTIGAGNTAVGFAALFGNVSGSSNTAIGVYAGRFLADGATENQTPANSVYIGYDTRASAAGLTNENVFGYGAIGNGSNSVTLGNTSVTKTVLQGNVSTAGNISTTGSGSIVSAGAISGPTSTNTINNLVINNGSLSNVGNITGAGAVTLSAGTSSALNLTGSAASTWDIGNNTLSIQTTNNGAIATGTGLFTLGGNLTFAGTSARAITGPSTGGLTVNTTSGPLTLSTTTSGTLAVTSAGALNMTGAANSTWSLGPNSLNLTASNFQISSAGVVSMIGGQATDLTTVSGGSSLTIQPLSNASNNQTGGLLTLKGGDATGNNSAGGAVAITAGSSSGGAGTHTGADVSINAGSGATNNGNINIGSSTAKTITIGNSTDNTAVNIQGTGIITLGGDLTFSGTTARTITGPSTGGLTVNTTAGPLTLSTTTSGTLAVTSAGALNLTSGGSSAVTLTSATGVLALGGSTATIQRAGTALTLDLSTASTSTLTVTNSDASNVANLSIEGSVNIASGQTYKINNADINTAGTLTNVAYENQANIFTSAQTIQATSASSLLIQTNTGSSTLLTADTSAMVVKIGATTSTLSGVTLLTASAEATTTVRVGTATNGVEFNTASAPVFRGTARPSKYIVLEPEYAGAALSADGSSTTLGTLTGDNAGSSNGWRNYYQWSSTQAALQDYTVVVRVTLPADFDTWETGSCPGTTCALEIEYQTGIAGTTNNAVSAQVNSTTNTPGTAVCTIAAAANTAWSSFGCTSTTLGTSPTWNTAGETAVIRVKLAANSTVSALARAGKITLRYKAKF